MRYTLLLVLSAVALASIGANSAHADRVAYDILGDARPSVGDDDEPLGTIVPSPDSAPLVKMMFSSEDHDELLSVVQEWMIASSKRATLFARRLLDRVRRDR